MGKKFAKIDDYGSLAIPLELLEKVMESSYLINTSWSVDGEKVTDVKPFTKFVIIDEDDIRTVLAQSKLEGQ